MERPTTAEPWAPLSWGQRALWFLHQLSPSSAAYNFTFAARIRSRIELAAFHGALQALVARHPILSTTYGMHGGPAQRAGSAALHFATVDASGWNPAELNERLLEEAHRPFDLEHGPVLRFHLFTVAEDEHIFLLAAHHIAMDFWSLAILLADFGEHYAAAIHGTAAPPPPRTASYNDYVTWQRALLESSEGERLANYWSRQLQGELPALTLRSQRTRPPLQTYRGATHAVALEPAVMERLRALSRAHETRLSSVLLAAFAAVLHQESGQDDILIGWPASGRRPAFAQLVGYLVNPVVVRVDVKDHLTFAQLLARTHAAAEGAWSHQDYPFALLVERLQQPRDPARSPVFQTLFALHDLDDHARVLPLLLGEKGIGVELGGLRFEAIALDHHAAMLDLSLIVIDAASSPTAYFQYNTDLFDAAAVARLAECFTALLQAIVLAPERRISDLMAGTPSRATRDVIGPVTVALRGREPAASTHGATSAMRFGLFYFASDEREAARDKYELLIEGAKFADRHGFAAVWTPERHFHAFGGLYPNPAVAGAALAVLTERVAIRAGSVVLPLHHPVRVAEEWSVVDNLSGGRAGISVASGWNANDFVLAPASYADRRERMARAIETVRSLWRGETLTFPGRDGRPVEVAIWPRPLQPELPVWISAFGSPETFRLAGRLGTNVLTHLIGQSVGQLAEKIALYRTALREHGFDPERGSVAVMLHTFVGQDLADVRQTVREPFLAYLRSSVDLARSLAQTTGAGIDPSQFSDAEIDAYLRATFDRHFASSALFGTPASCQDLVAGLRAAGVDEIACLIDFGVATDRVLASLHDLAELQRSVQGMPPTGRPAMDLADGHTAHGAAALHAERPLELSSIRDRVADRKRSLERQQLARSKTTTGKGMHGEPQ